MRGQPSTLPVSQPRPFPPSAEPACCGPRAGGEQPASITLGLSAVIVAATGAEPRVLTLRSGAEDDGLPSGPLEPGHRTLEAGLRAWVERQTDQHLGYVEQLYTFGDRDRAPESGGARRALSVAYLALVREMRPSGLADAAWQSWYRYLPWEDQRGGGAGSLSRLGPPLQAWAGAASGLARRAREDRIALAFGFGTGVWNEERVLERYELLFEAGLVEEAGARRGEGAGVAMRLDHRRMLATAIARLRGKIKYRPVVFELMPAAFTLLQLQRTVEALSGIELHKQNFRRLVEQQGLVEETGETTAETGGRPAKLVRFRREVLLERPAPGLRLPGGRKPAG